MFSRTSKMGKGHRGPGKSKGKFSQNKKNKSKFQHEKNEKKSKVELEEIQRLKEQYDQIDTSKVTTFQDLPLSGKTLKALSSAGYDKPTEIQQQAIGLALQGHDVLGAAKTGSGKTLAFLVPALECLWREQWSYIAGVGVLILSPTRELALQTMKVLNTVGKGHDLSAGLVTGGKPLEDEVSRISRSTMLVCTPGRLLQHLETCRSPEFMDNLQILVLDEADRILDLGFSETLNAILDYLPRERQTLLFSATQTKSVKDLARLSLKEPVYVSVHEHAKHSTPAKLVQSYMVCEIGRKLDLLWSFLRNHTKKKIIVFFSTCKQVRHASEVFRRLRCGVTVMPLHGGMKMRARVANYEYFCRKQHVVLFCTDVAARGLDFPAVNWVIQLDCPEDADTYIHRAGRTARFEEGGEALLLLLPREEEPMLKQLEGKRVPISRIRVNPKKLWSITAKLAALCAASVDLKEMAQRAFRTYLRCVQIASNKDVFNAAEVDREDFAQSLGLAAAPNARFLDRAVARGQLKASAGAQEDNSAPGEGAGGAFALAEDSDSDEEFLKAKPDQPQLLMSDSSGDEEDMAEMGRGRKTKTVSKVKEAKKVLKKGLTVNTHLTFDEEGELPEDQALRQRLLLEEDEAAGGIDLTAAQRRLRQGDDEDKRRYKDKIKAAKQERKRKVKEERKKQMEEGESGSIDAVAVLAQDDDDEEEGGSAESEADASDTSGDDSEQEASPPARKRRRVAEDGNESDTSEEPGSGESEAEEIEDEEESSGEEEEDFESMGKDEELALQLLRGANK